MLQLSFFLWGGIRAAVDTARYQLIADEIASGSIPVGTDMWYISYGMILAIIKTLTLSLDYVVVIHLLASLVALYSIYQVAMLQKKRWEVGFCASLLYLLFFKISQWHFILYTDSLFSSCCIICAYQVLRCSTRCSWWRLAGLVLLLSFTIFLRPVGLVFFFSLAAAYVWSFKKRKFVLVGVASCAALFVVNWFLVEYIDSFIDSYGRGEIIYPDLSLRLVSSNSFDPGTREGAPLLRLFSVFFENPIYFLKLFMVKVTFFLSGVRPYFSAWHNGFLLLFLVPCYGFAVYGWLTIQSALLRNMIFFFVAFSTVMIGLTSVNWDGRFLLPILPFVFISTASGIGRCLWKDR